MSHEITLDQANEKACQAEMVLKMLESYPDEMGNKELSHVITLARRLTGEVHAWLIEEQALREGK